jgi:signal transduction histidine kinase
VLREVLAELGTPLAGVEIVTAIEDCRIACSPAVLRQALYNVIDNASKYRSPERPLALRITGKRVRDELQISIEDNGLGMSAEAVASVFEPYYRAPATRSLPGSGLGLPIVRRTIEAIGGHCELSSELGRGTRFVICVPVA